VAVLRGDRQLALLPLLSGIASLVVMVTFILPITAIAHDTGGGFTFKPVDWVLAFVGYLLLTYVVVFFNAALVYAADRFMHGEKLTIGQALQGAWERAHVLLPWVILSATVSLVLRMIENRSGLLGRVVVGLVGLAWSLVTFLVLPILVIEGLGPIEAVKRSASLFKETWGENMIANGGIGLLAMLAVLAGAIVPVIGFAIGGIVAGVAVAVFVVWVVTVSLVASTLTGILQVALYRFATQGSAPGFSNDELNGVFRPRQSQSRGLFGGPGGFSGSGF
jgi:hypothetical protein